MEFGQFALESMVMKLKNKNILITGGDGFIGSHLVEELLKLGNKVIVTSRSFNPRSYFSTGNFNQKAIITKADIKDYSRIFDVITKYEVDFIFHLAAQAIVETAYYNPRETLETNILGTVNILESARQYPRIKGVLLASSDKAYGKLKKKYTENDPLKGDHPYEVSKASCDLLAQTYYRTYCLPVVITRFGNVYGPGDLHFNRIIPGIIKAAITNKRLDLRSDGTHVRDYVYAKDIARGCLSLVENISKTKGEAFNLSSKDNYSVFNLIQKIEKILAKKIKYRIMNTVKNEIPYQSLSCRKIKKTIGWQSRYNLEKAIPETFNWYKNYCFQSRKS